MDQIYFVLKVNFIWVTAAELSPFFKIEGGRFWDEKGQGDCINRGDDT